MKRKGKNRFKSKLLTTSIVAKSIGSPRLIMTSTAAKLIGSRIQLTIMTSTVAKSIGSGIARSMTMIPKRLRLVKMATNREKQLLQGPEMGIQMK